MRSELSGPQLQINLSAIEENYTRLGRVIRPGCRIAAVLKSDAYGLGIQPVGSLLARSGCRDFVVGTVDEAEALRKVARNQSIHVLYPDLVRDLQAFASLNVRPVINDERGLRYWLQHAPLLPVVLRIDTGLSTLGIDWREAPRLWERYSSSGISLEMLMSHLAAENKADIAKSLQQKERFDQVSSCIPAKERSLAASGGALLGPDFHYDTVRSGLYILGFEVDRDVPDMTLPAVRLEAPIIAVRDVPKGESIGYDLTCIAPNDMRIAVVFLGLSHGMWIPRHTRVKAQIGNWVVSSIGDVELEKTMFDVSHVPLDELSYGRPVRLIGDSSKIEDFARGLGAHPNELLCRFSRSVRRTYVAPALEPNSVDQLLVR